MKSSSGRSVPFKLMTLYLWSIRPRRHHRLAKLNCTQKKMDVGKGLSYRETRLEDFSNVYSKISFSQRQVMAAEVPAHADEMPISL
jgi:hypothetical protein